MAYWWWVYSMWGKVRQTAQWTCGKQQYLLEASELYLEAQEYRLNQEDQDALEDPGESEEGERVGSFLSTKILCLIVTV